MIVERRHNARLLPTCIVATPTNPPVCRIVQGLMPPLDKNGRQPRPVYFGYSPIRRGVVVGRDYIDVFQRFNQHQK